MAAMRGGGKLEAYLQRTARKLDRAGTMRAGFLEDATYPDGTPVATIAAIQNFGAPAQGIPPRPFFSNTIRKHEKEWPEDIAKLLRANDMDAHKTLMQMGQHVAGEIQEEIVETVAPPNSPVTNLLKQRFPTGDYEPSDVWQAFEDVAAGETNAPAGKPLVWSGHMLNSVDSEVTD